MMWSQMHGNESTTTKALFDLFSYIKKYKSSTQVINLLDSCTFLVIPMLNPDGAYHYTRNNAVDIDLNRDALAQNQPESQILRSAFEEFKPEFCFNLHGQRTIYGFKATQTPSVLSFLSPSADEDRSITLSRKPAMAVIATIFESLKEELPDRIGRYDDAYNLNCTGDYFQNQNVPTILFEAGHSPDDYMREVTRKYIFKSLLVACNTIIKQDFSNHKAYFDIPEHQNCYVDILVINVKTEKDEAYKHIAIQYIEELQDEEVIFLPVVQDITTKNNYIGHQIIDAKGFTVVTLKDNPIEVNTPISGVKIGTRSTITF